MKNLNLVIRLFVMVVMLPLILVWGASRLLKKIVEYIIELCDFIDFNMSNIYSNVLIFLTKYFPVGVKQLNKK